MTRWERRWCEALLCAVLPGLTRPTLAAFWPRFDASAPAHLRLGLRAATWTLSFAPLLLLRAPLFLQSHPDATLRRVAHWPGVDALTELVKVVACFAWFDVPEHQAQVRAA